MRAPRRVLTLALVLLLAVTACAAPEGEAAGEISVAWCDPGTLVPQSVALACAEHVTSELFDPLVRIDGETGGLQLVAAARVDSDDLVAWTIELHPERTFHDGTPVTATSFVDTWNFAANPANAQLRADDFHRVAGFAEVQAGVADTLDGLRAVDDLTLEVTLGAPSATFPATLALPAWLPLSPASLADPRRFEDKPIGNGPFRADEDGWVRGQGIRLVRWTDYRGKPPGVDAIRFVEYIDVATAYRDFLAGNVDIGPDLLSWPDRMDARARFPERFLEGPGRLLVYLVFPLYHPPYDDVRVRRALAYAFDPVEITERLTGVEEPPLLGWGSPLSGDVRPDACDPCRRDPEAAVALAAEMPRPPEPVRLHFPMIGPGQEEFTEAAGIQLRATLGLEYQLAGAVPPDLFQRAGEHRLDGPAFVGSIGDGPAPGLSVFLERLFRSTSPNNYSGYANPELDALLDESERTADPDERRAVLHRAEDLLFRDVPAVPMIWVGSVVLHSERVDVGTSIPEALRYRNIRIIG